MAGQEITVTLRCEFLGEPESPNDRLRVFETKSVSHPVLPRHTIITTTFQWCRLIAGDVAARA